VIQQASFLLRLLTIGYGTKLPFWDVSYPFAYEGKADSNPLLRT
jgi:hypothetical protein